VGIRPRPRGDKGGRFFFAIRVVGSKFQTIIGID
jgi:hypothetical protein